MGLGSMSVINVYIKDTKNGYVILCLYVDDILIVGSNDKMIKSTKNMLNSRFDMKDMRLADMILWIKITRISNGLILNLSYYVDKILEKINKDDSGVARTPLDNSLHLSIIEEKVFLKYNTLEQLEA